MAWRLTPLGPVAGGRPLKYVPAYGIPRMPGGEPAVIVCSRHAPSVPDPRRRR